jgi:hypothetical protein
MIHAATIALRPITTMSARCAHEVIAFDAATFRGEHSRSRAPHGPSHPTWRLGVPEGYAEVVPVRIAGRRSPSPCSTSLAEVSLSSL